MVARERLIINKVETMDIDVQKIVDVIDENLIERRKDDMTLSYANQLLIREGLVDDNTVLKVLLQEGRISHAYQTEQAPRQWRIPLSEEGKKRKKKRNKKQPSPRQIPQYRYVQCPNCHNMLVLTPDLFNAERLICLYCTKKFKNPHALSERGYGNTQGLNLSKKTRNWIIAGVIVLVSIILANLGDEDSGSSGSVKNSAFDASVHQVERYLKNNLKDPKSYKPMEWSRVNEENGKYWVRHKYRAKNSFGGYVVEEKIFYLDKQGNVIGVRDR